MTSDLVVFRAVLPVPSTELHGPVLFQQVRSQVQSWLSRKNYPDLVMSSGLHRLTDHSTLMIASTFDASGAETALRIQLTDDLPTALWRTTITSQASLATANLSYIVVELECVNPRPGVTPMPPALIRMLVDSLPAYDGPTPLTTTPTVITADDVDTLMEALTHVDRTMPMIVAALCLPITTSVQVRGVHAGDSTPRGDSSADRLDAGAEVLPPRHDGRPCCCDWRT